MREKGRDDDEERVRAQSISGEVTEPHIERNSENKGMGSSSRVKFEKTINFRPHGRQRHKLQTTNIPKRKSERCKNNRKKRDRRKERTNKKKD